MSMTPQPVGGANSTVNDDCQQRQMQLMCDILVHDTKTSACLNDEQKSLLATFEHKGANVTMHRSSKRSETVAHRWRFPCVPEGSEVIRRCWCSVSSGCR